MLREAFILRIIANYLSHHSINFQNCIGCLFLCSVHKKFGLTSFFPPLLKNFSVSVFKCTAVVAMIKCINVALEKYETTEVDC